MLFDPPTQTLNAYNEKNLTIANQTLDVLNGNDVEAQAKPHDTLTSKFIKSFHEVFFLLL